MYSGASMVLVKFQNANDGKMKKDEVKFRHMEN